MTLNFPPASFPGTQAFLVYRFSFPFSSRYLLISLVVSHLKHRSSEGVLFSSLYWWLLQRFSSCWSLVSFNCRKDKCRYYHLPKSAKDSSAAHNSMLDPGTSSLCTWEKSVVMIEECFLRVSLVQCTDYMQDLHFLVQPRYQTWRMEISYCHVTDCVLLDKASICSM